MLNSATFTAGLLLTAGAVALLIAGCSAAPSPAVSPLPAASPLRAAPPAPSAPGADAAALLGGQAVLDLAGRLALRPEQIEVISFEQTEMPIGSLGCGETGGRTQPGIIMGYEIKLRAAGREYTYRSDGQSLVSCAPADFPGSGGSGAARLVVQTQAISDLANRLNLARSAIKVIQNEAVEWPDASLGCPQPGMMYGQVITPGYRVILEAAGRQYEYHTSESRAMYCGK